jgi:SHS2 domain-containing protein
MTGRPPLGYEYFDVEADVGVEAWAPSLAGAFAQAALGVLALAVAPAGVTEAERREVRAQGDSTEDLLVSWINECLYVHEIEGFAVNRVEVTTLTAKLAHGLLHGETIDANRHRLGTVVKAATAHQLEIRVEPGLALVHLVVDV